MASDYSSQWIFTEEEIKSSPSILGGIEADEERSRRAKGANFITQAGMILRLPQKTIATACIFFQRFFMRWHLDTTIANGTHHYVCPQPSPMPRSLPRSRLHENLKAKDKSLTIPSSQCAAATALFIATKTEENCRKTKEIVIACAKVAQRNVGLIIDEQSKEYWKWRDTILSFEEIMLEFLTFDLVLESPYDFLYQYLQVLEVEEHRRLRNSAWAFVNDSCMTTLCIQQPAKHIAVAAIYFAARLQKHTIPDGPNGEPWWELVGGIPNKMAKAVNIIFTFYTENPLQKPDNPFEDNTSSDGDLERTRRAVSEGSRRSSQGTNEGGTNGTSNSKKEAARENGVKSSPKRKIQESIEKDVDEGAVDEAPLSKRAKTEEAGEA
jgi:protein BUR2